MKYIKEPSKKTPVMAKTDVLVVGSGPSGLAAAIASAREGVDTMLVERYGCFGGNITQAMFPIAVSFPSFPKKCNRGMGLRLNNKTRG